MLVGSSKWLRSAHMLSLFCLIVRIATTNTDHLSEKKITDFEALDKLMKGYARRAIGCRLTSDRNYIHTVWPYVDVLMKNYRSFFKDTSIEKNWKMPNEGYYHNEGIYKLCGGGDYSGTANAVLSERFKDLKAKMAKK
jgi:hypothetical protein